MIDSLITRLVGLIKFLLAHREGVINISALAAATAQREVTVQAGLDWLSARGQISITVGADGTMTLAAGTGQTRPDADAIRARLIALLRETAAYRAFYRRAEAANLMSTDS